MDVPYKHDIVRLLQRDVPLMRASTSLETEAAKSQHHHEHDLDKHISQQNYSASQLRLHRLVLSDLRNVNKQHDRPEGEVVANSPSNLCVQEFASWYKGASRAECLARQQQGQSRCKLRLARAIAWTCVSRHREECLELAHAVAGPRLH